MKIDGNSTIGKLKAYEDKNKEKVSPGETSQKGASSTPAESVELSARAKEITQIQRQIEGTPEIRQEKVNEISKKIDQGTYQVDAEDVAWKMIRDRLTDLIT